MPSRGLPVFRCNPLFGDRIFALTPLQMNKSSPTWYPSDVFKFPNSQEVNKSNCNGRLTGLGLFELPGGIMFPRALQISKDCQNNLIF